LTNGRVFLEGFRRRPTWAKTRSSSQRLLLGKLRNRAIKGRSGWTTARKSKGSNLPQIDRGVKSQKKKPRVDGKGDLGRKIQHTSAKKFFEKPYHPIAQPSGKTSLMKKTPRQQSRGTAILPRWSRGGLLP